MPLRETSDTSPLAARSDRRRPFAVAVAFLGAVLLLAVLVISIPGGGERTAPADAAPGPGPTADAPAPGKDRPAAGDCPARPADGTAPPGTAPSGITWNLYQGVALPSSAEAGPTVLDGDAARCFAHSPVGALLAAAQIPVRTALAADWLSVTRSQTVGAGKEGFITARRRAEAAGPPPAPEPGELGQYAGFRFLTYDADVAVLELVTRFTAPQVLQASAVTVRWQDGDWRHEVGTSRTQPKSVASMAGYLTWGGV